MTETFAIQSNKDYFPEPEENVMNSLFKQYERVIVESLITSFGLDFLVKDQHGGDVDTIHNVRQIDKDSKMSYKNKLNQSDYDSQDNYNSSKYHSDKRYIEKNRQIKRDKESGKLYDTYTGKKIKRNEKSDLDHTISAKEIHDDRGRVLSRLDGVDLANSEENLNPTNPRTNRTKKAASMDDFVEKYSDEYTEMQKERMLQKDTIARESYEKKIANAYYTGPQFAKDVTIAAVDVGFKMGVRQALGFVFSEIWFAIKEEFKAIGGSFEFGKLLKSIGNGIKRGFENAKEKYKELFVKLKEGAIAGALSSLTTTLCNIFFTTAKNVVKVIRLSYVSIVQAAKVLFINPENLPFGERMRAIAKIIATGASVVAGSLVAEALSKSPIAGIPVIGEIIQTFSGALVTGILSCTLLYYFDRSEIINKLVSVLNKINRIDVEVDYFRQQAIYFEEYAADLMKIDHKQFAEETSMYSNISLELTKSESDEELNDLLKKALNLIGVSIPWEGDFDDFMKNPKMTLVFK